MTSRVLLFPWKMGSGSAKALCSAIGIRRVYPDRNYRPKNGDVVINWGSSTKPEWWQRFVDRENTTIINHPDAVKRATNKITAFKVMSEAGVRVPEFTENMQEAFDWVNGDGPICCRTVINGHGANGLKIITDIDNIDQLPVAKLYTRYIKKRHEYRVHVFSGNIIDVTQKKLRHDMDEVPDYRIRNYSGGWVYARDGVEPPADVLSQAQQAVTSLGLDFGAVDIGWNEHYQQAVVYEVNSAPGLVGTTLYRYAKIFHNTFHHLDLHIEEPEQTFDAFNDFDIDEFSVEPVVPAVMNF